jgi:hypothetical protein
MAKRKQQKQIAKGNSKKFALFFSIWTQTPYGKKEKRGLNELLPKHLPFGSKHP